MFFGQNPTVSQQIPVTHHHALTDLITDPFPQALIELLASLPEGPQDGDASASDEPPTKRSRVDERPEAIPIARSSLTIRRNCKYSSQAGPAFARHDVRRYLNIVALCSEEGDSCVLKAPLVISTPQRSPYGKWTFELSTIGVGRLPRELGPVLHALHHGRDASDVDGGLAVSVDVSFERRDGQDRMTLEFLLSWNQSRDIIRGIRNARQRKISDIVQQKLLPGKAATYRDGKIDRSTPKAFYEAAFITDESYGDLYSVTIPNLTSKLFPFQRRALQWMLAREGVRWNASAVEGLPGIEPCPKAIAPGLPLTFVTAQDAHGRQFYHSEALHVVTRDLDYFRGLESSLKGGILAEEMGLGKTVETISLVLLHRRPPQTAPIFDVYTNQQVLPTGATLIVTPETLKKQWVSEVGKHAPTLRIMVYEGRQKHRETEEELIAEMIHSDIVITTYNVLRTEIHFARPEPERSRRRERKWARASSPLVKLSWWRVCLDEAQQIESGVSAAAEVARLVPRVNAWGVTGTPVKEKIKDLWGLLLFLRYEPFASYPLTWDALVSNHHDAFATLFRRLALRHTKHAVRKELVLPPQKRNVITLPFSAVEEQNYRTSFHHELGDLGLDDHGRPLLADWDPNNPKTIDEMRHALASLRQTVLHPQLGSDRARRVLAQINKPLKTIDEVLDAMIDATDIMIKAHQRTYLISKLKRGQLLENSPRVREALAIWQEALRDINVLEKECREQLRIETENAPTGQDYDLDYDSDDDIVSPRVGEARRRLRSALDLKHRAVFFIASAHYQIKTNEEWTKPDSDDFKRLETLEVEGYEAANQIRKEILRGIHNKASSYMTELTKKAKVQAFVEIPEFTWDLKAGIESTRVLQKFEEVGSLLNDQANLVDEWREQVIQLLLRPLVDQEEDEITGEEYEQSTKIQDEIMVLTTILRAAIADRQDALSGLVNERVKHEIKVARILAKAGEGAAPEKFLELLMVRDDAKLGIYQGSIRGVIAELRVLATKLRSDDTERSRVEGEIVQALLKHVQEENVKQSEVNSKLEKELAFFTSAMNARVDYYKQLQAVSDTVAPWQRKENEDDEVLIRGLLDEEKRSEQKMESAISTQRYQVHLKDQGQSSSKKTCPICTDTYTIGILTPCTHEFCKECIQTWVRAHRRCPICKEAVSMSACHEIVVREQKLRLHNDGQPEPPVDHQAPQQARAQGIYTSFDEQKLEEIKDVQLDGPALPTKVGAIVRHLIWLRRADPGAQSVIFSQFGEFLNILKGALDRFNIGYSSFAGDGITQFKENPAIECFLMDARAHASGLNLVNANHVFLCEPLLNTALELQAIARVDRIGQEHETNIWLYLVEGTVEESIYNLSVKRRMGHMADATKGKGRESATPEVTEDSLEVANSLELQQAVLPKLMDKDTQLGEFVDKNDLWECLFGHVEKQKQTEQAVFTSDSRFQDTTVMRFLSGRAAEERQAAKVQHEEHRELMDAMAAAEVADSEEELAEEELE